MWFFGTPVGELYPILGDYLVIVARIFSVGILDWPQAYAVGFTIAFLAQGWVLLRAGRTMGLGPWPGLVAAGLALLDVGSYREGRVDLHGLLRCVAPGPGHFADLARPGRARRRYRPPTTTRSAARGSCSAR